VQHRGEEEKVFAIDQRDLDVRSAAKKSFQFDRRVQSAKAAAEDKDASTLRMTGE
jgi:hypothetical protein